MKNSDYIVFIVDDLAKATRWYADVLGCQPGYSYPTLGMEQVWCGAALIVLWDITHPGAASAILVRLGVAVFLASLASLGPDLAYRGIFVLMAAELVIGALALRRVTEPARDVTASTEQVASPA